MLVKPKYAENIIVGIRTPEKFSWYVTERDIWILDINIYSKAYLESGAKFDKSFALSLRNNIDVVDENTVATYLNEYSNYIVLSSELGELVINKDYDNTILELRPSLYIDFIGKNFISWYPESLPFEKYVPYDWKSDYGDFTEYISFENRYWIIDGINLIDELFKLEENKFKGE